MNKKTYYFTVKISCHQLMNPLIIKPNKQIYEQEKFTFQDSTI